VGGIDPIKDKEMNQRTYRKIVTRIRNAEMILTDASILMGELDGGLETDLDRILNDLATVYEVMDERRDRGEYPSLLLP